VKERAPDAARDRKRAGDVTNLLRSGLPRGDDERRFGIGKRPLLPRRVAGASCRLRFLFIERRNACRGGGATLDERRRGLTRTSRQVHEMWPRRSRRLALERGGESA
jgi:hypothetical protein